MSAGKPIDVREQKRLGLARTFHLTVNGIRYRLFRSSVTLVVVAVAVAFLMNILAESAIKKRLAEAARDRLREYRIAAFWASRLASAPSLRGLLGMVAEAGDGAPELAEFARFAGLDAGGIAETRALAADADAMAGFLEKTDYGRLRLLTRGRSGIAGLDYLAEASGVESFLGQLALLRTVRPPLGESELREMAARWPDLRGRLAAARDGHARAIRHLRDRIGSRPVIEVLSGADGADGGQIRSAGFELGPGEAARVARAARFDLLAARVEAALENEEVRRRVAARLNLLPLEVTSDALWRALEGRDGADWFAGWIGEDAGLLRELAVRRVDERRMQSVEPLGAELGDGPFGMGQRMAWLAGLSLLVCAVGISNAMLMSVTERYREIATFKCLGALDGSIMLIFMIEAALIGSAGGLLGALAGGLLALLGAALAHGALVFAVLPVAALAGCGLFSMLAGVTLAAAASVYPSQKAARLAPMEAMRIE